MTEQTVTYNDEDMASVLRYSREKRVRIGFLLALLPMVTVALWIIGLRMPPASFNTVGAEVFILGCYVALFLALIFPQTLPELPGTFSRAYSLACLTGIVYLLRYCLQKQPPQTAEIYSLTEFPLPFGIMICCLLLWFIIVQYRQRLHRPLASETINLWAVLIVVLCLSFSIFYRVWAQAREKSTAITCLSNMKQLDLAVQMYSQDWDERLPQAAHWASPLSKYLSSTKIDPATYFVFHCPGADSPYSYASNRALSGISTNEIAAPADALYLFESDSVILNTTGGLTSLTLSNRHNSGLNFGFLDGHVKWMQRDNAAKLQWLPALLTRTHSASPSPNGYPDTRHH
jgi:prepilin-type processing-associated H-X9-DG protein